jgi:F-type H+-transporting ATPase subunit b
MADFLILAAAAEHGAEHAEEAVHATALGLGAGGWVALSMIALIVLMLVLKVPAMVGRMLDAKIASIRSLLDEAAKLRKEAEALKTEYEARLAGAAKDAETLTSGAQEEAKHILAKAQADAEALIVRRQKMAEDKIGAAERAAVSELRQRTADAAARAAHGLIAKGHSADADKALVDAAIAGI